MREEKMKAGEEERRSETEVRGDKSKRKWRGERTERRKWKIRKKDKRKGDTIMRRDNRKENGNENDQREKETSGKKK